MRDPVFKARLREQFLIWEEARTASEIPTLAWWEGTVKPGVRNLLKWRGREMKKDKLGSLNLLLLRQSYLVKKLQEVGRNIETRGGQLLGELRAVQVDIRQWYREESEKIKIQAKTDDINSSENVRIYHHSNNQKHIKQSAILKLETENGTHLDGHQACMDYIQDNVFKVFGVPPVLDEEAQKQLLREVNPVFTEEDNKMLGKQPTKEEVKERLWRTNMNSSPGSDGLTYLVYKECWDTLGDALTRVMICLHNGELETPTQRLSLMVFAPKPKKPNSIKFKDKRTLSLINCDKKLSELIITYRLKIISPRTLSANQLATGGDRKIYHGVNSARDAIQVATNNNMSGAMVDVDLVAGFNLVLSLIHI